MLISNKDVYLGIEMEAVDALPVVHIVGGEVLAARGHLEPPTPGRLRHGRRTLASPFLQSPHQLHAVCARHDGVLTRGLLHAAPPRVAHNVDNWRPVREPRHALVVECASFSGHHLRTRRNSEIWVLIILHLLVEHKPSCCLWILRYGHPDPCCSTAPHTHTHTHIWKVVKHVTNLEIVTCHECYILSTWNVAGSYKES